MDVCLRKDIVSILLPVLIGDDSTSNPKIIKVLPNESLEDFPEVWKNYGRSAHT